MLPRQISQITKCNHYFLRQLKLRFFAFCDSHCWLTPFGPSSLWDEDENYKKDLSTGCGRSAGLNLQQSFREPDSLAKVDQADSRQPQLCDVGLSDKQRFCSKRLMLVPVPLMLIQSLNCYFLLLRLFSEFVLWLFDFHLLSESDETPTH